MRMTKKITSIVLAVLMVVSMISVMAVTTASAANVAKIGTTNYESFEAAWNAAQDGDTITLLADSEGNGLIAPQGKYTQGLTVDFNGKTYSVTGNLVGSSGTQTQAFQLLKDNNITFKNGTIYSEKAKMLVQNYSNLTLDNMTLTLNNPNYAYGYTLSNNNGNTVIKDTTINANPAGGFAFDACRFSSYPSVSVTVTGDSKINGNVEVTASGNDVKDGLSLNLENGTMAGEVKISSAVQAAIDADPDSNFTTDTTNFETVTPVAEIGAAKFATLEDAWNAAQDGATIKLLANSAGNGLKAPQGKFATGLTVDFNSYTYTVDGSLVGSTGTQTQAFQLLKDNKITFKDGTIYSEKAKMLVQKYCDLTLDNMTLTLNNTSYNGAYTLSNNNGNTVIKDTTINANPTTGSFAFDVCRGGGNNNYPSVNVKVTGDSVINGDVEVYAKNSDPKDGLSLTLESGTMTGDIVLDKTAQNVIAATPEKVEVTKKNTFSQEAPLGYEWKDNGDGTSSIIVAESNPLDPIEKLAADINDGNAFGIQSDYLKGTLLGVQKKATSADPETSESHQENGNDMRFVAVLDTTLLQGADDYGFILGKVDSSRTYADTNINKLVEGAATGIKKISAVGTYNTVCGTSEDEEAMAYGNPAADTPYKYVTCAVNGVDDGKKVVARFYYKKGGKTYYAKYAGQNYQYTGCMAGINASGNIY